jgi:hypothetical protein
VQELPVGRITVKADTIKTPRVEGMTLRIAGECRHQGKPAIVTLADSRVERGLAKSHSGYTLREDMASLADE